jgi:branched-chain amino acid transport system ATP-binding protein
MMGILEVQDIYSGYGDVQILNGINLSIQEGKLTALVGANGVGKTTLLRTVMGLLRPIRGKVRFNDQDITHLSAHTKAELGLILAPEGRQLFTTMSVAENLELGATPKRAQPHKESNLERVYEMFPRLKDRCDQKAGTLSGGEQQMVAIARGILSEPVIFMIDELSLGLSPAMSLQLFETLLTLKKAGLTVLLVEQNVQMALAISDYAYVISEGRTDLEGPGRELIQNEKVRIAYFGSAAQPGAP